MIRQKSNGFFIPDEKISVDMDIVISSLKVPYLRVSYYGTEQLSIPDGQTLSFILDDEEIKLSSKRESNRLKKGNEAVEVLSYLVTRGQMKKYQTVVGKMHFTQLYISSAKSNETELG